MSISIKCDKYTAIDLIKCPHILVGGSTGSGKSYLMKCMLRNVLESPECNVVVVDPKCVDYQFLRTGKNFEPDISYGIKLKNLWSMRGISMYDADSISDNTVLRMLMSLVKEMRNRYNYMKTQGYVQWAEVLECESESYDSPLWGNKRIVLFIDELADLIYADRDKLRGPIRGMMESMLIKIATLGRAAGIHLILGTQRPDATILSGQLRANIPTRIGLKCTNNMERRIILGDSCKDLGERVLFYGNEFKELVREIN